MKFAVRTSGHFYNDEEEIKKLEELGFKFNELKNVGGMYTIEGKPTVKISSLKALIEFSKKYGVLVFDAEDMFIEIYDDHRE